MFSREHDFAMSGGRNTTSDKVPVVVPLIAATVRWDETTHHIIREEARSAGVTFSQFVREAAIIRALLRASERDAPGRPHDFRSLAAEVERLSGVRGQ